MNKRAALKQLRAALYYYIGKNLKLSPLPFLQTAL